MLGIALYLVAFLLFAIAIRFAALRLYIPQHCCGRGGLGDCWKAWQPFSSVAPLLRLRMEQTAAYLIDHARYSPSCSQHQRLDVLYCNFVLNR